MHPLIGSLSAWNVFAAASFLLSLALAVWEARRLGLPASLPITLWPCLMLGAYLGGHLYFLLTHPAFLEGRSLSQLMNIFSGVSIQGAALGVVATAFLMTRLIGQPLLPVLDVLSPAGALGQAVGRLGCLAMGCCYGKPTALPFGIVFSDPYGAAPKGVPLHPTQLYEAGLCLALAVFLHLRLKSGRPGTTFARYLLGYAGIRFFVQFFRNDDAGNLVWGLAHSQFTAAALALAGLLLLRRLNADSV